MVFVNSIGFILNSAKLTLINAKIELKVGKGIIKNCATK